VATSRMWLTPASGRIWLAGRRLMSMSANPQSAVGNGSGDEQPG
jgi:hypothetical protein